MQLYYQTGVILILCLHALVALAKSKPDARVLPFPPKQHSLETLVPDPVGALAANGTLFVFPFRETFIVVTPFSPGGDSREQVFGKIVDSKRRQVTIDGRKMVPRGGVFVDGQLFLLDGEKLTMTRLARGDYKEVTTRSIAWDLIRPPRDRGGEATTPELNKTRALFKRRFLETQGLRLAGLAPLPKTWGFNLLQGRNAFILATRIKGFPILIMECQSKTPSQCLITRHCFVEGDVPKSTSVSGIVVVEKKRIIYLADRAARKLSGFKFHSCFHITPLPSAEDIKVPSKVMDIANVHADDQGRLWLLTERPDHYHNASLYFWEAGEWQ